MKIIKKLLLGLAILLLLISVIGLLFFSSHIEIRRSVVINAAPARVFGFVNDLRNYNEWSPWYEMDTTALYSYQGPFTGKGARINWESDDRNVGSGSMTYTDALPDSLIRIDLDFMKNGIAKSEYRISPSDSGSVFTWVFMVEAGANPLMRIIGSFMEKLIGADFEKGLSKLKKIIESAPAMKVERVKVEPLFYLSMRLKTDVTGISKVLGESYAKIMEVMRKQNLDLADAPFAIYHTPPPMFDLEVGIPVVNPGKDANGVTSGSFEPGEALMVRYFGPYEKSDAAHALIHAYVEANAITVTGSPWESYVTDPSTETDTAKWETDVYYPVK